MSASRLLRPQPRQLHLHHGFSPFTPRPLPRNRLFHASAPRSSVYDTFLMLPHELLHTLHTYMPWYAAIPVSAFIVRGLLVTTIGSHSKALIARYMALQPLRQAMALQKRDDIMKKGDFKHPKAAVAAVTMAVKTESKALDRRWNCTLRGQVGWTLLQLPLFVVMAEVIRRVSDIHSGLLGLGMEAIGLTTRPNPDGLITEDNVDLAARMAANPWFEPSLATEGLAWFPNLLVPDPTGALPFVVSAVMFANIFLSTNNPTKRGKASPTNKGIRRGMMLLALLIGPMGQHVPAALMYYWVSSTTSVMVWNVWLDKRYPVPEGFGQCSRPLLNMPTKKRSTVRTAKLR
ncbi:hypothetical protein EJ04DRAFT_575505 [Polyplosphaeria fusca]|uniref:Uncharacterized protein n=1 Tax=Polyplosphaeria fusca TaxID=682080 RepID=A0A9P4V4N0_9PLEO|nr:hypothetical protein EJ04DRAFT_575505 [Polyplosphaeria fusca]